MTDYSVEAPVLQVVYYGVPGALDRGVLVAFRRQDVYSNPGAGLPHRFLLKRVPGGYRLVDTIIKG
jgi:hypothetical protein